MKTFFIWIGGIIGVIVLAVGLFFIGMRFHDGPLEIISGGPFTTGDPATAPEDWSYLKDRATLEFQTMDPQTSRTVWLAVYEGQLYLFSGYMTTGYGKVWKQWPHYIADDNRVILRIDGKLYEQQLIRIMGGDAALGVLREIQRKYAGGGDGEPSLDVVTSDYLWMYRVDPR